MSGVCAESVAARKKKAKVRMRERIAVVLQDWPKNVGFTGFLTVNGTVETERFYGRADVFYGGFLTVR